MKYKLIELIEQVSVKCGIENHRNISGINIQKRFMPSKNSGSNTSNYKIVGHNQFACNLMHVGRDEKIPIALNFDNQEIVVSPAYTVFRVSDTSIVNIDYLNMIFTSSEFDRYAWFCTDASIRGNLDWERFLDIQLDLPPLHIQEKYVAVYKSMLDNQQAYETGLEDLKLVCDATIEKLRREIPSEPIGKYLELVRELNTDSKITLEQGVNISKEFITPQRKNADLSKRLIVRDKQFVYSAQLNNENVAIAYREGADCVVSPVYTVFKNISPEKILDKYLMLWFSRSEWGRFVYWQSTGSSYEFLQWESVESTKIPIPDICIQQSIVDIYNAYIIRKKINEKLKQQIKDICPILISGAIKESNANG